MAKLEPDTENRELPTLTPGLGRVLDAVRRRAWLVQWSTCIASVLVFLGSSWWLRVWIDWKWHLPWGVRAMWLAVEVVMVLVMLWRLGVGRGLVPMNRHQTAVLMERRLPEVGLELHSGLVSAVEWSDELERSGDHSPAPESWLLVKAAMGEVEEKLTKPDRDWSKRLFAGRWAKRLGLLALILAASGAALMWSFRPVSALLWQRLWLSRVELPNATTVIGISGDVQVMAGESVRLLARAEGVVPEKGQLRLVREDGGFELMEVQADPNEPDLYVAELRNVRDSLTYRFEIHDGISVEHRVTVMHPPVLKEIRFVQRYPDYTGLQEVVIPATRLRLLHGSMLKVEGKASKALKEARLQITDAEGKVVLEEAMILKDQDKSGIELNLEVPGKGWSKLSVKLLSQDEVHSMNDPVYRIELIQDVAPELEIFEPREERMTMLADDRMPVRFRVSDDYGLAEVGLCYRVVRPGLSEGREDGRLKVEIGERKQTLSQQMEWHLMEIAPPLTPGCRVVFWLEAIDGNTLTGPSKSKSIERTIEIVTPQQKRLELLELLGQHARMLERLHEMQREANEKTDAAIR